MSERESESESERERAIESEREREREHLREHVPQNAVKLLRRFTVILVGRPSTKRQYLKEKEKGRVGGPVGEWCGEGGYVCVGVDSFESVCCVCVGVHRERERERERLREIML